MIAEVHALASIPEALTAVDAAPLLWAGVTTYNGLVRDNSLLAGDLVAGQVFAGSDILYPIRAAPGVPHDSYRTRA